MVIVVVILSDNIDEYGVILLSFNYNEDENSSEDLVHIL